MRDVRQHEAHTITRIDYLNDLAAQRFPKEWGNALRSDNVNKRKARLRKRYQLEMAYEAWRKKHPNVTCATCSSCSELPNGFEAEKYRGLKSCDHGEGKGWYQPVDPDVDFCIKWNRKTGAV